MKKIGIMGGTFNPIHFGHLFLAENAFEQVSLDKVLFMPSKNPPHKAKPVQVSEQQRVDMINLAISNNPHFELSTLELHREGLTFTADTLRLLTAENSDTEYYFIVGMDSLFMMQNWKEPQVVFDLCTIVVAGRDNSKAEEIQKHIDYLKKNFHAKIIYIEMPMIQIASAEIRERYMSKRSVRYFMPDSVIDYIAKNQLYTATPEEMV
jgi:nicotinate (nicotinamide) nucleotide adenylyltransferase